MCIHAKLTVHGKGIAALRVDDLIAACGLPAQPIRRGVEIFPVAGCGCAFAESDPTSLDWQFDRNAQPALERALRHAAGAAGTFEFSATWMGDAAPNQVACSVDELVQTIREGKFSTRTTYIVAARS